MPPIPNISRTQLIKAVNSTSRMARDVAPKSAESRPCWWHVKRGDGVDRGKQKSCTRDLFTVDVSGLVAQYEFERRIDRPPARIETSSMVANENGPSISGRQVESEYATVHQNLQNFLVSKIANPPGDSQHSLASVKRCSECTSRFFDGVHPTLAARGQSFCRASTPCTACHINRRGRRRNATKSIEIRYNMGPHSMRAFSLRIAQNLGIGFKSSLCSYIIHARECRRIFTCIFSWAQSECLFESYEKGSVVH